MIEMMRSTLTSEPVLIGEDSGSQRQDLAGRCIVKGVISIVQGGQSRKQCQGEREAKEEYLLGFYPKEDSNSAYLVCNSGASINARV